MTVKDLGIVFIPNSKCVNFIKGMTMAASLNLPNFKKAPNNPHITAIHIANLDEKSIVQMKDMFKTFATKHASTCIDLPVKGIRATGGSIETGFKWLDLDFELTPSLANIRKDATDTFCPLHKGMLTRMNDDYATFNEKQLSDIEECGVTFSTYVPHTTAWYVDLPNEAKTAVLQDVAEAFKDATAGLSCSVDRVALVELGRNGNAVDIVDSYPLAQDCLVQETPFGFGDFLLSVFQGVMQAQF